MCTAVVLQACPSTGLGPGDAVRGLLPIARFQRVDTDARRVLSKFDPSLAKATSWLGLLGVPGAAAYFAVERGDPRTGEVVLVIGACGAVGSGATALCCVHGAQVYGMVRSQEQATVVQHRLGARGCCVCTEQAGVSDALSALQIAGNVALVIDTVGGLLLDACLPHMAHGGRIVSLGDIQPYTHMQHTQQLLLRQLSWHGFRPSDHRHRLDQASRALHRWVAERELRTCETAMQGLERLPEALHMLRAGVGAARTGRLVLELGLKHTKRIQEAQPLREEASTPADSL
eukprot:TRINITY_DN14667_c0_g1_i4.p1 TRINITY_DN14667_c0_g1~~TRINITY_DN14667_c0_g1_i4.p1  ORF type:complete len:288 (-),score=74.06 TRINITY_DN14667_c0_g1_i4:107-970(-)